MFILSGTIEPNGAGTALGVLVRPSVDLLLFLSIWVAVLVVLAYMALTGPATDGNQLFAPGLMVIVLLLAVAWMVTLKARYREVLAEIVEGQRMWKSGQDQ